MPVQEHTKPLPKQHGIHRAPIKKQSWKPAQRGYTVISKERFDAVLRGEEDVKGKLNYTNGSMKRLMIRKQNVFERYYKTRDVGADSYTVHYYYLIENFNLYPRITLLGKAYPAQQIACLHEGAGGNYTYKQDADGKVTAYRVNSTTAPHGLRCYDPATNKPVKFKCRDGDPTNLKWDNIKPDYMPVSGLSKIPQPPKGFKDTGKVSKKVYRFELCVDKYHAVKVEGMLSYAQDRDEAKQMFMELIGKLNGKVKKLRDGSVQVIRPFASKIWKE